MLCKIYSSVGLISAVNTSLFGCKILFPQAAGLWKRGEKTAATFLVISFGHASLVANAAPLEIVGSSAFQHNAVEYGWSNSFTVTARGDPPLFFQWQLDGRALPGETNATIRFTNARPDQEGDYRAIVSNGSGAVASDSARLWVVPSASAFIKSNFTSSDGLRLPYFFLLPTNYPATEPCPLFCVLHGAPGDESMMTETNAYGIGYLNIPLLKAAVSYRQQTAKPLIMLWPTRRINDWGWTAQYLRQVSELLNDFVSRFPVDTNRVYIAGTSEGVHAAWDLLGMKPGFFAAAQLGAGEAGSASPVSIKQVPLWATCAADDSGVGDSRRLIYRLRLVGGNPIYSEYRTGGHSGGIRMAFGTPAMLGWLVSQRLGGSQNNEPRLEITAPTVESDLKTGAQILELAGTARAMGENITTVVCTNLTSRAAAAVSGTNDWRTAGVALTSDGTNAILISATTTSWAAGFGGSTSFGDTLMVYCSPIRARLSINTVGFALDWTGGVAPFQVQRTTDLSLRDWALVQDNAVPPLELAPGGSAAFFRVVGR